MSGVIFALAGSSGAQDIEEFFMKELTDDLSGKYSVRGDSPDVEEYSGSVELKKWNTFTTQRGNIL